MTNLHFIKLAAAALNQTPMDWRGNRNRIVEAINRARGEGIQVLCLPELCISGYGCEDAFHGESVAEQALQCLQSILPETRGMAVAVGLPILHGGDLFNGAALLVNGEPAGVVAKQLLAGYGVYYEPRWFKPWPAGSSGLCRIAGREVPIGDLVFDLDGVSIGFEICEDAWGRGQSASSGSRAHLLLNPSASHFAFGKHETLKGIVVEGSRAAHSVYLYANLLGNESGRLIYDGTAMIASNGRLVAESRRFSFDDISFASAIVDLRSNRLDRRRLLYPPPAGEPDRCTVSVPFTLIEPSLEAVRAQRAGSDMRRDPHLPAVAMSEGLSPFEEFSRAVSLGLWDYMRKSGNRGLVVSLSGGVDSGTVAILAWMMTRLAVAELGWERMRDKLNYFGDWDASGAEPPVDLTARLLTTVYQATANSSATTRKAASSLAQHLGCRHLELDVEPLVQAYEQLAEKALHRKLDWATDDTARQNIQARVRAPGIWLLANLEGRLLVSTSNRSEVGVGYCTMDGDTSGGLAPIAGANKTFLRNWLRWIEVSGLEELGPIPAVGAINSQAPTAELRPLHQGQTDEDDLMPYPVLDAIEQAAIRDRMSPVEVWRHMLATPLPGIDLDAAEAAGYVERFFRLWSRTQWKRERLAPSFHLDDENLDPKTWCRFPILSGGYETELEALRTAVAEAGQATGEGKHRRSDAARGKPTMTRVK